MPESPPKRITRSRAKAAEMATLPTRAIKIATPASKLTKVTGKRKAITEEVMEGTDSFDPALAVDTEPVKKPRGRPKKTAGAADEQSGKQSMGEVTVKSDYQVQAPKRQRGRPKKTEVKDTIDVVSKPRAAGVTERLTRARVAPPSRGLAAVKKRVTFQEQELDKENQVPSRLGFKRAGIKEDKGEKKPAGLSAKPIRRAASTKSAQGTRKAAVGKASKAAEEVEIKPLSPKKAQQNAPVLSSTSEEDELAVQQTPLKPLSKSPVKLPTSASVKTNTNPVEVTLSPTKHGFAIDGLPSSGRDAMEHGLSSPARRPPPSPFKDALKDSPKRINMPGSFFSQSAFRPTSSPFRQSIDLPVSPTKGSLLLSPARKPPTSPSKSSSTTSPSKLGGVERGLDPKISSFSVNAAKHSPTSPRKNLTAAFRASISPERSSPMPKIFSTEEQTPQEEALDSPSGLCSPSKSQSSPTIEVRHQLKTTTIEEGSRSVEVSIKLNSSVEVQSVPTLDNIEDDSTVKFQPALTLDNIEDDSTDPLGISGLGVSRSPSGSFFNTRCLGPPDEASPRVHAAFRLQTPATQYPSDESGSEDELQRSMNTTSRKTMGQYRLSFTAQETQTTTKIASDSHLALRRQVAEGSLFATASGLEDASSVIEKAQLVSLTPLARQLENWRASSPEKFTMDPSHKSVQRIFFPDPLIGRKFGTGESTILPSPAKNSFFDDEMSMRERVGEIAENGDDIGLALAAEDVGPEPSEASQEYGDENAIPIDPALMAASAGQVTMPTTATCTPAKVFLRGPHVVHTVSKVPLKPAAADESFLGRSQRRSNSIGGPLLPRPDGLNIGPSMPSNFGHVILPAMSPSLRQQASSVVLGQYEDDERTPTEEAVSQVQIPMVKAPGPGMDTPMRTPRPSGDSQTLKGAVVFVDVHTTEGADASGLFVELLTQMGARCVKQWNWNPGSVGATGGDTSEGSSQKIGITHVVFKDGGKRTLEKVRESKGVVLCVGVSWVLE